MGAVVVSGAFDDLRSRHVRFLQEASKHGEVIVALWSDELVREHTGRPPKFGQEERRYLVRALRGVYRAHVQSEPTNADHLPADKLDWWDWPKGRIGAWIVGEEDASEGKRFFCRAQGIDYVVVPNAALAGFPEPEMPPDDPRHTRPRVIVTGCYDWLHSGHVRFFEEAAGYGDLYVGLGSDANIRSLKGEGHPLFPEAERRYMVASIRHVHRAFVSSGSGWLDAEPEMERIRPDVYIVNEDGNKPEKAAYCRAHGIDYVVLTRQPREGLPRRQSTDLRGF